MAQLCLPPGRQHAGVLPIAQAHVGVSVTARRSVTERMTDARRIVRTPAYPAYPPLDLGEMQEVILKMSDQGYKSGYRAIVFHWLRWR